MKTYWHDVIGKRGEIFEDVYYLPSSLSLLHLVI